MSEILEYIKTYRPAQYFIIGAIVAVVFEILLLMNTTNVKQDMLFGGFALGALLMIVALINDRKTILEDCK